MGVPKWRQNGSRLDAFFEATKLRHIVTQMIMRTYRLKTGKYKHLISDKLRAQHPDLVKVFDRIDKYQENVEETKVLSKYDDWIVNRTRNNLFRYCSNMIAHISAANEIKCTMEDEYIKRILLQDDAICDVENIKQEVNFVEEFFDIDLNKYMNYSEQQEKVKNLLYRWKKSTVKDFEAFKKKKAEANEISEQKEKAGANSKKEKEASGRK